jgi:tungstate transport system substrate-binding protein
MKRLLAIALSILAVSGWSSGNAQNDDDFIVVASTTSTQNSGLFDHLLPKFEAATGIEVRVVALGTGAALAYGRRCDADVLVVHAPAAEQEFVDAGYGVSRVPLMHNDFVVVGPGDDPAGVRDSESAAQALEAIAQRQASFVSRGDRSGTHMKELALWRAAGLEPGSGSRSGSRSGSGSGSDAESDAVSRSWYREAGAGMGQSLNMARAMDAYILADRGTWLSFGNRGSLEILFEGDPALFNPYSAIAVDPAHCPSVRREQGRAFIEWLVSDAGQRAIEEFRVAGQVLFVPHREPR